ncbi:MAG: hypothetical protein ABL949_17185 [Fimbriimonadaceae bacterium]
MNILRAQPYHSPIICTDPCVYANSSSIIDNNANYGCPITTGTTPGTREAVVSAYRFYLGRPARVSGLWLQLADYSAGSYIPKLRAAIFDSDGDYWGGTTDISTGLPRNHVTGTVTGVTYSTLQGNTGIGAGCRFLKVVLPEVVKFEVPQMLHILVAAELVYTGSSETQTHAASVLSNVTHALPTQAGGTGESWTINPYHNALISGIDSFDWTDFNLSTVGASSWIKGHFPGSTTTIGGKPISGGLHIWNWRLIEVY